MAIHNRVSTYFHFPSVKYAVTLPNLVRMVHGRRKLPSLDFLPFLKSGEWKDTPKWCRVAIIWGLLDYIENYKLFLIFIPLYFVITLEAPLDVEQEAACGSQGEEDGPPRTGKSIDSLGRLMLSGI